MGSPDVVTRNGFGESRGRSRERLHLLRTLVAHRAAARRMRRFSGSVHRREPRGSDDRIRALFLSAYPPGHYGTVSRLSRWGRHLSPFGIDVEVLCPSSDESWAAFGRGDPDADARYHAEALAHREDHLRKAADADVVLLHRAVLPFSPLQRPTFEQLLAAIQPRLVFDFYDSIWVLRRSAHDGARSAVARWMNPPDMVESIIRVAAAVTVSSPFLEDFARPHHERVELLPMTLEPSEYHPRGPRESRPVVLGWMGNRFNIPRLLSIAPALRRVAGSLDVRLRVVAPEKVEIPGLAVESLTHPWSEESEKRDLDAVDIGLLPMFDQEEDRGKFPFKLLQFAAAGLPVVASPVAIDERCFVDGESIRFAADEDGWVRAISSLVESAESRGRQGMAGRSAVERHYSFSGNAASLASLLREVADGR